MTAANGKDASETPTSEPSDEKDADVKREHSDEGTPVMQASNTKNSNEDDKGAADAPPVKAEPGTEPTIKKESGEDARASEEHGGGGDGVGVSCPDIGKKDSNTVDGEGPPAAETDASARAPEISSQETGTAAEDATPPSTAEPSEPAGAAGEGDASEAGTTTTLRETLDISAPLSGTTAPAAETPVEGALEESAPPPATPQDPLTDEPPALESEVWTAPPALADPEDDDYDDLDG